MYYVIFVHPALSNLACQDWPPQKDFRTEFPLSLTYSCVLLLALK